MIEVISRVVMTGSCDQCGEAAPLYMTQDECGHTKTNQDTPIK